MTNGADLDQLASSEANLIWIYTVCKGRVHLGSAGQAHEGDWIHLADFPPFFSSPVQKFLSGLVWVLVKVFKNAVSPEHHSGCPVVRL